tara:strand:+ start:262 stop:486 length:225 start_codon:yes stop_codon:yes gene_type:complete
MRVIVLFLMFVGVILITIGYMKTHMKCPPPIVKFKYIPKTFEEEQNTPIAIKSIYGKMFTENSPWEKDISNMVY